MASLNQDILGRISIRIPPIPTQRRIACVLSVFNELIEINERQIELLEQLGRSLYREWFVRFRFPGHEDVELVDSELGPIPKGWEVAPLGDVVGVNERVLKAADLPDPLLYLDKGDIYFSQVALGLCLRPAATIRAPTPSCWSGSLTMPRAWTTWSGCAGRRGSAVRAVRVGRGGG